MSTLRFSLPHQLWRSGAAGLPRGWLWCLWLLPTSLACPADPRNARAPETVARVGDEDISRAALVAELVRMGTARVETVEQRQRIAEEVLDRMIREALFVEAAQARNVQVDPRDIDREVRKSVEGYLPGTFERVLHAEQLSVAQYREKVQRKLTVDAYLQQRMSELPRIEDATVRTRYEAASKTRTRPREVRARQVLLRTEEEANHLYEEIRSKRLTLEDAARRYSIAPEQDRGGDLGWFAAGDLPPVFETCFALAPGEISEVVTSEYGFHIFEVTEAREAHAEPFEEVKHRIEAEVRREQERAHFDRIVLELRASTPVVVTDAALRSAVALLPAATDLPPDLDPALPPAVEDDTPPHPSTTTTPPGETP